MIEKNLDIESNTVCIVVCSIATTIFVKNKEEEGQKSTNQQSVDQSRE